MRGQRGRLRRRRRRLQDTCIYIYIYIYIHTYTTKYKHNAKTNTLKTIEMFQMERQLGRWEAALRLLAEMLAGGPEPEDYCYDVCYNYYRVIDISIVDYITCVCIYLSIYLSIDLSIYLYIYI